MHLGAAVKRWLHSRSIFRPHRLGIGQACVIGAVAGLSATLLSKGVDWLDALRVSLMQEMPHGIPPELQFLGHGRLVLPIFGVLGGLIAGYLVQRFGPDATGSGIPQVKAALSRVKVSLNFKTAWVKLLGGTIVLGSGLLMGREGPTVFVSAALASEINRLIPTTPAQRRQLLAAGAGAGLAAAFHAPIAGVMFVLEELLKDISSVTIGVAVLACFVASVVATILDPVSDYAELQQAGILAHFRPWDICWYVIIGLLCGVVGAAFNRCIIASLNAFRLLRIPFALKTAIAGLLTGLIVCSLPTQFAHYGALRQLLVLHHSNLENAILSFAVFFSLPVIAYGSGAPGGLFAPSLSIGSAIGFVVAAATAVPLASGAPQAFALAGMGGMFASVARVPVTAIIIIFEMTRSFEMVLPLMVVCIVANMVAEKMYPESIYDRLMDWSGIRPKQDSFLKRAMSEKTAGDIMTGNPMTLDVDDTVKDALEKIRTSSHERLPVVEGSTLVGVATCADFETLAKSLTSRDLSFKVAQIMTPNPLCVSIDQSLTDVLFMFERFGLTLLPVTNQNKLVGVITRTDLIHTIYAEANVQPTEEQSIPSAGGPNQH